MYSDFRTRSAGVEVEEMGKDGDFRCIECGKPTKELYIQYSPGNIRLMKCENCKATADEYIECEIMIIVIDLILHKPKAYRHLFYNMLSRRAVDLKVLLLKLILLFLVLDVYRMWLLSQCKSEPSSFTNYASLSWHVGKIFLSVLVGNLFFVSVLAAGSAKFLCPSFGLLRCKDVFFAILVSSYFKIFLVSMVVWEFHSSMTFIVDMFVVLSNTVALKVVTQSAVIRCLLVCLAASALKVFAGQGMVTLLGCTMPFRS